ncbi:MAG TPA: fructose-bisphosphatase class II, partial [Actinomycetota bacterium]|nr:fructose-bisphosphatase class II [Actinomycetota bacterium]
GVVAAAALKCIGGALQGKLYPRNEEERSSLLDAGYDLDKVITTDDLVGGDEVFFAATGVTTGAMLRGVRYRRDHVVTSSMVMRSHSGTVRYVEGHHQLEKLMRFSDIQYR